MGVMVRGAVDCPDVVVAMVGHWFMLVDGRPLTG